MQQQGLTSLNWAETTQAASEQARNVAPWDINNPRAERSTVHAGRDSGRAGDQVKQPLSNIV